MTFVDKPRIQFGEPKEVRPATIESEFKVHNYLPEYLSVEIGNTGFKVIFRQSPNTEFPHTFVASSDFTPGGRMDVGFYEPLAGMKIFCYALFHFQEWLKTNQLIKSEQIIKFHHTSNKDFAKFLSKLFAKTGHESLISLLEDERVMILNLDIQALLHLPPDDELSKLINTFTKRAEGMVFEAVMPMEK